jgi:transposase InsO family protein
MSKQRLMITAVLAGQTQSDVARRYGVSRGWISKLMTRWRLEGEDAFEPRSRRPKTSPTATPPETIALSVGLRQRLDNAGLDDGAETISWHLTHSHHITLNRATIHRILTRQGLIEAEPKKRPKSSYLHFAADQPNECWQSDFTHYRLSTPEGRPGADTEIITWLDDHSRYALHLSAHLRITAPIVLNTFTRTAQEHGYPASTLTDNGWFTPYASRAAETVAAAPASKPNSSAAGSSKRMVHPITRKTRAKSNASNKHSRNV